ncbi:MAG: type II toxin-antitoxin system RelE/ParE family toxin [Candidatus Heimdallarchaeota archaeon]|nr:type II toxin-antitoxin system RelE/ParE family toxin [Candidatus Heimdallarchaeota archaeon]
MTKSSRDHSKTNNAVLRSLNNPLQVAAIKLKNRENTFRLRVGDYRVLFKVYSSEKIVVIIKISHRKKAYR